MSIESEIKKNSMSVFRRIYIKKREADGEYSANWTEIDSQYIKKYGAVTWSVDEVIPSFYRTSGLTFQVINKDGRFSSTEEEQSFFSDALTVYRTLVKVEAGYTATDGTEYPTDPSLFLGFISEDLNYTEDSMVSVKTKHISSVFEEFSSDLIVGLGAAQSASDIVTKIRDHLDSNSISIFQKYISLADWNIQTTTTQYNMATSTSLQGLNCWQLMQKLAVAEDYVMHIDGSGKFYFQDKNAIPSVASYHYSGIGDEDKTYGHNIIGGVSELLNIRKIYNRIKIKLGKGDTTTSWYIKNESWNWGDSSSSFIYGIREYDYNNQWLDTATAETIADTIFSDFSYPKKEVSLKSKFTPNVVLQDRVSVTYKTQRQGEDGDLWAYFLWGYGRFGERPGYNLDIANEDFRVISIKQNVDNFTSELKLRAL